MQKFLFASKYLIEILVITEKFKFSCLSGNNSLKIYRKNRKTLDLEGF